MKTKIIIIAAALAMLTGCKEQFKINYDFNIAGHATGEVAVNFPNGHLNLNGATELDFGYGNLDTTNLAMPSLTSKQQKELVEAVNEVADEFSATSAEGTYYLLVDCVVTEEMTGAEVRIRKVLTNEE